MDYFGRSFLTSVQCESGGIKASSSNLIKLKGANRSFDREFSSSGIVSKQVPRATTFDEGGKT